MRTVKKKRSFGLTGCSPSRVRSRNFEHRLHQDFIEDHLVEHDIAGLIVGMGLGKTAACLYRAAEILLDGGSRGFLVVAPMRVANMTWPHEVRLWNQTKWLRVANLRTEEGWRMLRERSAHIYVCNYEFTPRLIRDYLKGRRAKNWAFDSVIYDEVTMWKNPDSVRAKAFAPYNMRMQRRWTLTGTPAANSLLDIYGQMLLLDGGKRLGKSFKAFKDRYFYTVGDPSSPMSRKLVPFDWAKDAIYKKISDVCLTLRREDFLDCPDVHEEDIEVTLPDKAQEVYDELEEELLVRLEEWDKTIDVANAGVLMNKLLQVTGGAIYHTDEETEKREWFPLHDAKIKALKKFVKSRPGEPVMVLANYQHEQERIRKAFPDAVFMSDYVGSKEHLQPELRDAWNRREIPMLVSHPKSIGHGLNLQEGGNLIVWFTLNWSRELYDQVIARLARQGQERITEVYRLMCAGSVDWAVAEALRQKDENQRDLIDALVALQEQARQRAA